MFKSHLQGTDRMATDGFLSVGPCLPKELLPVRSRQNSAGGTSALGPLDEGSSSTAHFRGSRGSGVQGVQGGFGSRRFRGLYRGSGGLGGFGGFRGFRVLQLGSSAPLSAALNVPAARRTAQRTS